MINGLMAWADVKGAKRIDQGQGIRHGGYRVHISLELPGVMAFPSSPNLLEGEPESVVWPPPRPFCTCLACRFSPGLHPLLGGAMGWVGAVDCRYLTHPALRAPLQWRGLAVAELTLNTYPIFGRGGLRG